MSSIEEERKKKYEEQTTELYQAIGKYCVKFEHISFAMQNGIKFLLSKNGLQNQQISNIILAGQTAQPLHGILQALIAEMTTNISNEDKSICNKIFARTMKAIEKRNDVIHSTWFVGWANQEEDEDFATVDGFKHTKGKTGAGIKDFKYKPEDFLLLTEECEFVENLINRLWSILLFDKKISDNFVIDTDGNVLPSVT